MKYPLTKPKTINDIIANEKDDEEEETEEETKSEIIEEKKIKPKKKMVPNQLKNLEKGRQKIKEVWDLKKNIEKLSLMNKTKKIKKPVIESDSESEPEKIIIKKIKKKKKPTVIEVEESETESEEENPKIKYASRFRSQQNNRQNNKHIPTFNYEGFI